MRRIIFAVLVIWMALSLAPVAAQQGVTYYVNVKAAKMRAEPKATAKLVTTLARGKAVVVLEIVIGEKVSNVDTWYKVNASGKEGYILSSLLTDRAPATANSSAGSGNTNSGSKPSASPTNAPAPVSPIPQTADYACSCSKTCKQMASCEEAYFQLNQCGCNARDGDHDGVPCETICLGG